MKITFQQLSQQLKQKLASIYLISGDEYFLVQEAINSIRNHASENGFTARESYHVESGFVWQNFLSSVDNLSLLTEPTIVELKFSSIKLGDEGSKTLQSYVTNPARDKIILLIMPKLDAATQKTKWFKAVENAGIVVQIWPLEFSQLPGWVASRLKQYNLTVDLAGIKILVDYVEGNLLAAQQEIEKLSLMYPAGYISADQVIDAIADNARFNMFDLVDSALMGNGKKILRILAGLRDEGLEPVLILWAIAREVRSLVAIKKAMQQNDSFEAVAGSFYINFKRKNIIKNAVLNHTLQNLKSILYQAGKIDLIVKGAETGDVWQELQNVCLKLANIKTYK